MTTKDEALKLALEALEDVDGINTETECVTIDVGDVMDAIKQALAAPVQQSRSDVEPVAIALNTGTKQGVKWLKNVEHGEKLYTTPPNAATPLDETASLAAPAPGERKRQSARSAWVGLTDEETKAVIAKIDPNEHYLPNALRQLSLALEAKLKEKNSD